MSTETYGRIVARHAALVAEGHTPRAALDIVDREIADERVARAARAAELNRAERHAIYRLRAIIDGAT